MAFKQHNKEVLRQVLSVWNGVTVMTNESENWPPVGLAKVRQSIAGDLTADRTVRTREYDAPTRRHEPVGRPLARRNGLRGHGRRWSYLRVR